MATKATRKTSSSPARRVARSVEFGGVKVRGAKLSAKELQTNVEQSSVALSRAGRILERAGVSLRMKKSVPQFSAVENEPGVFLRLLNGKTERGHLVNGVFQVID